MSAALDELHHVITDLEGEGHSLAGRFRDLLDRIKTDFKHLVSGGKDELETFVESLVETLTPELDKLKADVVAELHKVLGEVKAVVEAAKPADPAPALEQVEPDTAPTQG